MKLISTACCTSVVWLGGSGRRQIKSVVTVKQPREFLGQSVDGYFFGRGGLEKITFTVH